MKSKVIPITNVTHPWLNAQDISTIFVSAAGDPYRCEVWIRAPGDNLNLREDAIDDVHSAGSDEEGELDDEQL